ncbi:MAG TPA: ATP-binding protein [Terriglobales bacterium]|nr:ATP-binding protein [Terriglobales bacterium]
MDLTELQHIYADLESDRVERKSALGNGESIREAICALANDLPDHRSPGVIFVGTRDNGECAQLPISDDLLKRLSNMASDGAIQPFPSLAVQKHTLNGCEVAVVRVSPAVAPPVRYKGRVLVRVGPTNQVASPQQEALLSERRRAHDLPFDARPLPSASLEDLNFEGLPALLPNSEPDARPIAQKLAGMRLASAPPESVPTALGVLSLGKDPTAFVPGAYIQFLRLDGTALTDPILDQQEILGPVPELIGRAEELLKIQIRTASNITAADRELQRPDYPIAALQQLLRNAVMHRNYESSNAPIRVRWFQDRVEIQNPGGPYGVVTPENFGQGLTDYRNPNLAAVMKDLGFVQRFGIGIETARAELKKNRNPPPEFDVQASHVQVTVRSAQ